MTIPLFWQLFRVVVVISLPALGSFMVGSSLAEERKDWEYFKILWRISVAVGFVLPPILLWVTQSEYLNSWLPVSVISAVVCFITHALGAVAANRNCRLFPNHESVRGIFAEFGIIAGLSAVAGFVWTILPGGQESGWIFATLLGLCAGYVYFVYDESPKGKIKKDLPLMIMSFVIEVVILAVLSFVGSLVFTGLSGLAYYAQLSALQTWLESKTFMWLLLVFWSLTNLFLRWVVQEPKEKPLPDHVFR